MSIVVDLYLPNIHNALQSAQSKLMQGKTEDALKSIECAKKSLAIVQAEISVQEG
jgi:hypothetical protein